LLAAGCCNISFLFHIYIIDRYNIIKKYDEEMKRKKKKNDDEEESILL
jgi:hypothetical protein